MQYINVTRAIPVTFSVSQPVYYGLHASEIRWLKGSSANQFNHQERPTPLPLSDSARLLLLTSSLIYSFYLPRSRSHDGSYASDISKWPLGKWNQFCSSARLETDNELVIPPCNQMHNFVYGHIQFRIAFENELSYQEKRTETNIHIFLIETHRYDRYDCENNRWMRNLQFTIPTFHSEE